MMPLRSTTDHIYRAGTLVASYKKGAPITVIDELYPDTSYPATYCYKADKHGAIVEFLNGQRTRVPFIRIKPRAL